MSYEDSDMHHRDKERHERLVGMLVGAEEELRTLRERLILVASGGDELAGFHPDCAVYSSELAIANVIGALASTEGVVAAARAYAEGFMRASVRWKDRGDRA